jgi:hypothetical protein
MAEQITSIATDEEPVDTDVIEGESTGIKGLGQKIKEVYSRYKSDFETRNARVYTKLCEKLIKREREYANRPAYLPEIKEMDEEFITRVARIYQIEVEGVSLEHIQNLVTLKLIQNLNDEELERFTGTKPEDEVTGELTRANKIFCAFGAAVGLLPTGAFLAGKNTHNPTQVHDLSQFDRIPSQGSAYSAEPVHVEIHNPGSCAIQILNSAGEIIQAYKTGGDILQIDVPPEHSLATNCLPNEEPTAPNPEWANGISMVALLAAMQGMGNLHLVNAENVHQTPAGNEITVAVIDWAFNFNHSEFSLANSEGRITTYGPYGDVPLNEQLELKSKLMHGTMVSSTIIGETTGIAPHVRIAAISSPDLLLTSVLPSFMGDEGQIEMALAWRNSLETAVDTAGAQIVVIPLGGLGKSDLAYNMLSQTIEKLSENGVYFVFSAGNEGYYQLEANTMYSQLAEEFANVLFVGATDAKGNRAKFSNGGEVYAPGTAIATAYEWPGSVGEDYFIADGTSFAGPITAGVIAVVGAQVPEIFFPENYGEFSKMLAESKQPNSRTLDAEVLLNKAKARWGNR